MRPLFLSLAALLFCAPLAAEPLDDGVDHTAELASTLESAVGGTTESRAGLLKEFVLPDAATWFGRVFGEKAGARGAERYAGFAESIARLDGFFSDAASAGATKPKITRWAEGATDGSNDGGVGVIFAAMKEKVAIYSVVMLRPDDQATDRNFDISYFVWAGGSARLVLDFDGAVIQPVACLRTLKDLGICAALHEMKHKTYPGTLPLLLDRTRKESPDTNYASSEFHCPCTPDVPVGYKYLFPVDGDKTPADSILAYCPQAHEGKRHLVTFGGAVLALDEGDFKKKLAADFTAARKALPAMRDWAKKRSGEKLTPEQKAEIEEFAKALDVFEAEAKALLDTK